MSAQQNAAPELKAFFGAALETALNDIIALDELTVARLTEIDRRFIALEVKDLNLSLTFHIQAPHILLMTDCEVEADTLICTNSKTLIEMGMQKVSNDKMSLHGKLEISGDIETGQTFKAILDNINIDWEEHFSHIAGDVVSHQVFRALDKVKNWSKQSWQNFAADASAWTTDEQHLSPHKIELEKFSAQVNKTRNDVERAAARVGRLINKLKS